MAVGQRRKDGTTSKLQLRDRLSSAVNSMVAACSGSSCVVDRKPDYPKPAAAPSLT
jgi:hypothetical protein